MFNKILAILVLGCFSTGLLATTFQVMPLDKLVEESNTAAEVELKSKRSYMNKMGMIFTEFTFAVGDSYGLNNNDLDGEFLKINMTGGTFNGVTSYIDGAPDFVVGERSFLLLKRIESKMYLSNFTMGKYKIEEQDGQVYYVSTVFPRDAEIGRVKKEKMIEMVKLKYKLSRAPEVDSFVPPKAEKKELRNVFSKKHEWEKRSPAQEDLDKQASHDGLVAMWGFFGLIMVSGFTIWWKLRQGTRA